MITSLAATNFIALDIYIPDRKNTVKNINFYLLEKFYSFILYSEKAYSVHE